MARLIGAPPGYVGFEEGGQLTEAVRRRPYAVVLFDETEKAHGDVFNVLLQILDDGRVTDSQGRGAQAAAACARARSLERAVPVVSFRNAIVILTSNIGSSYLLEGMEEAEAAAAARERVMVAVRAHFRPEFVNRIDDFIVFEVRPAAHCSASHQPMTLAQPLSPAQIGRIVRLQVARVAGRLAGRKIGLKLTEAAYDHLAAIGFDPVYGARPVKRAIQHSLETLLATAILRGDLADEDSAVVDLGPDGRLSLEVDASTKAAARGGK